MHSAYDLFKKCYLENKSFWFPIKNDRKFANFMDRKNLFFRCWFLKRFRFMTHDNHDTKKSVTERDEK